MICKPFFSINGAGDYILQKEIKFHDVICFYFFILILSSICLNENINKVEFEATIWKFKTYRPEDESKWDFGKLRGITLEIEYVLK